MNIKEMILYEDNDIIVCEKPAGFPVQSKRLGTMDMESGLKNYLVLKGEPAYLAVVHRLDQPVQGVLVFGKNKESGALLGKQIQQGKMEKIYLAYVQGYMKQKEGSLINEIEKDGKNNISRIVEQKTAYSKKAELEYKVLKVTKEGSLLEIRLHTGRHHQIRVQMAYAGCPIFGDVKYNLKDKEEKTGEGKQENISLCAYRLSFYHPKTRKRMEFQAKPIGNFPIV